MSITIQAPKQLNKFTVELPASKSISNRLLILNALSYSPHPIKNLSDSDDTKAMLQVFNSNSNHFDIGAAGTTMRFLTAYLSKIVGEWTITGSTRMKQRPIAVLVDALNQLGGKIEYMEKEGYPPLRIFGSSLTGGELELPGDISSQYISALLMIGPAMENGLKLRLTGEITSRPYIHLTLKLMEMYGVKCHWKDNIITVPVANYKPVEAKVESDWSAASYWFEIIALSNPGAAVTLKGLDRYSWQGDSAVAELFKKLGVHSKFSAKGLTLTNTGESAGKFSHDFTKEPDLAQTFAVTCAFLNIPFNLTGLHTLKIKETDRIQALVNELGKFGFILNTNNKDNLVWKGDKKEADTDIEVATYKDHRMAMAFAPAALKHKSFKIADPTVVTKSYPAFWEDLKKIGFEITG
ncbi:3-phosphoshikimate 1-carboxyvinyltransferase [Alkalitalea saponilacus]|uniref:3-phosphoshikimate 1-carboxyvinyltransferase n=1 Tax=Alkalitalea saponilacus TaxID=889453 RepID=A0A1T5BVY7_9BACT|nr:3-phosphoshikimate 1-carboxyvinyltransferase [Alkalitalea saponilacus]ASB49568.1 3-phosphoshikimate 1-carboxyvinyltransferase [Alkalitalea saponilacus]SKB51512.1 3-phosphoshikimate 1-carboxyvinyltransferase [Alkalitalea saponilacus]